MSVIHWIASLTAAERDAIRTLALVIGSAGVPVFGLILTWSARVIKRQTRQTVDNTAITKWADSKLHSVSVAELANRIHSDTAGVRDEFRSEISDLVNDPRTGTGPVPRIHGRRRDPTLHTDQVPRRPRPPASESMYHGIEGEPTDE